MSGYYVCTILKFRNFSTANSYCDLLLRHSKFHRKFSYLFPMFRVHSGKDINMASIPLDTSVKNSRIRESLENSRTHYPNIILFLRKSCYLWDL